MSSFLGQHGRADQDIQQAPRISIPAHLSELEPWPCSEARGSPKATPVMWHGQQLGEIKQLREFPSALEQQRNYF